MKPIRTPFCAAALMMTALFAGASVLSDMADTMQVRSFAKLPVNPTLTTLPMGYSLWYWNDSGEWDPINKIVRCVGGPGTCCANPALYSIISYEDATNTWSIQRAPYEGSGHGYDATALDPVTGDVYWAYRGDSTVARFNGTVWDTLPRMPMAGGTTPSLTWFPGINNGRGALLYVNQGGSVAWFDGVAWHMIPKPADSWQGYNQFSQYDPIHKAVFMGGGNGSNRIIFKLDTNLALTRLKDAPVNLGNGASLVSCDPVSGLFVITTFTTPQQWWTYDVAADAWTNVTARLSNVPALSACFQVPIPDYGVILYFSHYYENRNVTLFKYTDARDTTAPSTAPAGLAAEALSHNAVRLTWTAGQDLESGVREYIVRRFGVEIGRSAGLEYLDTTSRLFAPFTHGSAAITGLSELTSYDYTVEAMNWFNLSSGAAGPVTAITLADTEKPHVLETWVTKNSITLFFNEPLDSASAVEGYVLDNGGSVQSVALSANKRVAILSVADLVADLAYTLTLNGQKDQSAAHNEIAANTEIPVFLDNSVALVDFGASADANVVELTGWDSVFKDVYTGYSAKGPGGMTITGSPGYNYQGVRGTARTFAAGERIAVTWYNDADTAVRFIPMLSLNYQGRPANGGTWTAMDTLTVAPKNIGVSEYAFASAAVCSVVSVTCNFNNNQMLVCDRIELILTVGSAAEESGSAQGLFNASVFPNPFNPQAVIAVSGARGATVRMAVYDVRGRLIHAAEKTARDAQAGFSWNAEAQPSGLYLLKITAGGRGLSKKILLQK